MMSLFILVLGALYIILALWLSGRSTRLIHNTVARLGTLILLFAVLVVLPIADGIWGNYQLRRICATELRTQVLGTVSIPASLLDSDGKPKKLDGYNSVDWAKLRPYVYYTGIDMQPAIPGADIRGTTWVLVRTVDGARIVEQSSFYYRGGWLKTNGDGPGAGACSSEPTLEAVLPTIVVAEK